MCRHPLREAAPSIRNKVGKFMMLVSPGAGDDAGRCAQDINTVDSREALAIA
jgi:hypothetical protein